MIIELAIGDAYGAGFEYVPREIIERHNDLSKYISHQKWETIPGTYTDDTQMSLALCEMLVDGCDWTRLNLANKFVRVFKRDERNGYAGRFYDFLKSIESGEEFLKRMNPNSDKSGGAMRASVIGYLPDLENVLEYSSFQASLTHDTEIGRNASIASSLMTHYFLYDLGGKKELGKFIEEHVLGKWDEPWKRDVRSRGDEHVRAAITAVMQEDSLSSVLRRSINFGGDVDTVATISMAAASCCDELEQDIPIHLIECLENGEYGRDYLIMLEKDLKGKFGFL
ncbi:ADP-ribosylglycohydrolase family protein [Candidatus Pacearchaeota archaeon]|nr:ADP-ribosylglycohydrolase family protein [Candidatus Pacearchaeota archaeon]